MQHWKNFLHSYDHSRWFISTVTFFFSSTYRFGTLGICPVFLVRLISSFALETCVSWHENEWLNYLLASTWCYNECTMRLHCNKQSFSQNLCCRSSLLYARIRSVDRKAQLFAELPAWNCLCMNLSKPSSTSFLVLNPLGMGWDIEGR